jgi:hypothetical protein
MKFGSVLVVCTCAMLTGGFQSTSLPTTRLCIEAARSSSKPAARTSTRRHVSSGFVFGDGQQILASLQKPLGLILEETVIEDNALPSVFVAEVLPGSSAAGAGLMAGDVLVAVQNADMKGQSLETVMAAIQRAPKVLNLRVQRR